MSKQPDNKSDRILSKRDLFFAWFRYNMFADQPCRTAKPYSRSFHRSCMGSCCIYHDHGTED